MIITDFERYKTCLALAKTYMMIAKVLKEQGNNSYKHYVKQGIEACYLAIKYRKMYEEDITDIVILAA